MTRDLLKPFLVNQIGNIKPNINNLQRDAQSFEDTYFSYLLLNGKTINKTDYLELFAAYEVTEDTFNLPNFNQDGGPC